MSYRFVDAFSRCIVASVHVALSTLPGIVDTPGRYRTRGGEHDRLDVWTRRVSMLRSPQLWDPGALVAVWTPVSRRAVPERHYAEALGLM